MVSCASSGSCSDVSGEKKELRIPPWLRVKLPRSGEFAGTAGLVEDLKLHTVCQSARCPNIFECFSGKVATFLILGGVCTRACAYCNIDGGRPEPVDPAEPGRVAEAVGRLGLRHVVITSVTRDDLPDGGAGHFAAVITRLKADHPGLSVEVLIPDFAGSREALETVLAAGPDILNHNVETVSALFPRIRPQATYARSLELLARVKAVSPRMRTKSGFMVGLGEDDDQVRAVVDDLADVACDIVTVGQYLRPSRRHPLVERYVHPDVFEEYAAYGRGRGIRHVFSAPLVRSSYNAAMFADRQG